MANTTAQLILEAGTREPTQRLGFGLRLGNAPESPAPTTVTYRYTVICDCVLFSTGTQSMNFITMLSKFTYGYLHLFSGLLCQRLHCSMRLFTQSSNQTLCDDRKRGSLSDAIATHAPSGGRQGDLFCGRIRQLAQPS